MRFHGGRPARDLLVFSLIALMPTVASADIMKTCTAEIGKYCSDVRNGKGRIAACLYAYSGQLSGDCASDVKALGSSRTLKRMVPAGVTELKGSPYEAELRSACASDAAKLCPGVSTNDERVLACLYARDNRLSGTCKSTGKRVLSQIK